MNNRKTRVYVNGTSALKIQPRDNSQGNLVCLGRSKDGRLFVEDKARTVSYRKGVSESRVEPVASQGSSLRQDLRVAYDALGVKDMENSFVHGTVAGKALVGLDSVRGLLFGAAVFFAALAVVIA